MLLAILYFNFSNFSYIVLQLWHVGDIVLQSTSIDFNILSMSDIVLQCLDFQRKHC